MSWVTKAESLITALASIGVKATMDPRKVSVPGALIVPPTLKRVVGSGLYAAWEIHLVAPAPADLDSVKWLLDNLDAAFEAVGADSAQFANLTIDPAQGSLPAYSLTIIAQPL